MPPTTIPHAILESRPKDFIIPNEATLQINESGECAAANPRVQGHLSSVVADNEKIATNSYDFKEMFKKSSDTTEERIALYVSDREWVRERNILETFYTTREPLTKKNMKGYLVNLNTAFIH